MRLFAKDSRGCGFRSFTFSLFSRAPSRPLSRPPPTTDRATVRTVMVERLSAAQIRQILGLELHPTCGFTCVTHVSSGTVAAEALPAAYALLSTVEFPGFTPEDLEVIDPEELCARYPEAAERIREFTP